MKKLEELLQGANIRNAAAAGDIEELQNLLNKYPHCVNSIGVTGVTALINAVDAAGGYGPQCVEILLKAGADQTLRDTSDRTAYDLAEDHNAVEVLQLLNPLYCRLGLLATIICKDDQRFPVLARKSDFSPKLTMQFPFKIQNLEAFRSLEIDHNDQCISQINDLPSLAGYLQRMKAIRYFLFSAIQQDECRTNRLETYLRLMKNINIRDRDGPQGESLLIRACRTQCQRCVEVLVEDSQLDQSVLLNDLSAYDYASDVGNVAITNLLNPHFSRIGRMVQLISDGDVESLGNLLVNQSYQCLVWKCLPFAMNSLDGQTARINNLLSCACRYNHYEIVQLLFKHGADRGDKNAYLLTESSEIKNLFSMDALQRSGVLEGDWLFVDSLLDLENNDDDAYASQIHDKFSIFQDISVSTFSRTVACLLTMYNNLYTVCRRPQAADLSDIFDLIPEIHSNFLRFNTQELSTDTIWYKRVLLDVRADILKFYDFYKRLREVSHRYSDLLFPVLGLEEFYFKLYSDLTESYHSFSFLASSDDAELKNLFTVFVEMMSHWNVGNTVLERSKESPNYDNEIDKIITSLPVGDRTTFNDCTILLDNCNTLLVHTLQADNITQVIVKVNLSEFESYISRHAIPILVGKTKLSAANIDEVLTEYRNIGEVGLLQIAMSSESRVSDSLRKQILYGLLLSRSLTFVLEGNEILAPCHEITRDRIAGGKIVFLASSIILPAPNLSYFCNLKLLTRIPIADLVGFLLEELRKHPDSLCGTFRMKSYASIINKLFYRAKDISDLFAATARTHDQLSGLINLINKCGGRFHSRSHNGNHCEVMKYVRSVQMTLTNPISDTDPSQPRVHQVTIPIYYEIVYETVAMTVAHEAYELKRLDFKLNQEERSILETAKFSLLVPSRITA